MDISKVADKTQIQDTKLAGAAAAKNRAVKGGEGNDQKAIGGAELSNGAPSSEKVKWSDDAQFTAQAVAEAKAAPDTRADKIAQLKLAVQNGTYKPDAKAIAEKMIQSSVEEALLNRKA